MTSRRAHNGGMTTDVPALNRPVISLAPSCRECGEAGVPAVGVWFCDSCEVVIEEISGCC